MRRERISIWYKIVGKRFLDVSLAGIALVLLSPLLIILSLLVWLNIGRPIFFSQERPGKDGKLFKMYKFRTMTNQTDDQGELLPDSERLTTFGLFLRGTSLDELPELVNVVKGEMSLVGPRPLLSKYLTLYNDEQKARHDVKPGLTGLAQVSGRNLLSWEDKLQLDVYYVDHLSLFQDIKIVCLTVVKIIKREGISAHDHSTMEEFQGSKRKK